MKATIFALLAAASPVLGQDCAGWIQRMPEHSPSAAISGVMAFDSLRSVSVLFNAIKDSTERQTWEWDGSDWSLRTEDGPDRRTGTAMVYDSKRGVTVLFGGKTTHGSESDIWEWNGQGWMQRNSMNVPLGRLRHAMAYDSARGVLVLFGGLFNQDAEEYLLGDTWEWDGVGKWQNVSNSGPSSRSGPLMAYDTARGVTVLFGGGDTELFSDTWEWDGQTWKQRDAQGPTAVGRAAMVYDADLRACVLYGGDKAGNGIDLSNETWTWDGQAWTRLDTPINPGQRAEHAMAFDSTRHAIVLFGGRKPGGNVLSDTWEFACTPPCYPDLDGNGTLDLFDFLAFVNAFNAGEGNTADCDHSGALDLFDFLCFTNAFNAGC